MKNGHAPTRMPRFAEVPLPPSDPSSAGLQSPAEFVKFVELARQAFAGEPPNSAFSTNSAGGYTQTAIYPEDSILADWMAFTREREESADVFLLGSILPVCATLLARRVWFQWGWRQKYANVFSILTGKPGDRKSSVIMLAENLARRVLPTNAFLPGSFSPESLFDQYDEDSSGRPDKLWIVDDANGTLKDWQKSVNGERVATRFLELYDCKGISESYRRNKSESNNGEANRVVKETSTSLLFGATFNIAAFQGQEVRAGMARRFLYYVAEKHGRLVTRPQAHSQLALVALADGFRRLLNLAGVVDFDSEAALLWNDYQRANRVQMEAIDLLREAELSRLSSAPMQTLSVAMIFAACRWAKDDRPWTGSIGADTLTLAIEHVNSCVNAANHLDGVAHRAEIKQDAEILLAKVRHDVPALSGFHFATRSELTKRYCANSARAGSWRPDDLYLRFIPLLERRNEARMIDKVGKREVYAFTAEVS